MQDIIDAVRKSWSWCITDPKQVLAKNAFGNLLVRDSSDQIWRLCPEELEAKVVAKGKEGYQALMKDADFRNDWDMPELREAAREELGSLDEGQVYCLKRPGVLGGDYSVENVAKMSFLELLAYSGKLAKQVADTPDGEQIELDWEA